MSKSIIRKISKVVGSKNKLNSQFEREFHKCLRLYEQGKYDDALMEVMSLNVRYKKFAAYNNTVGKIQQGLNNLEVGPESFKKAVKVQLDYYEAHNNLGVTYSRIGQQESAYSAYNRAIQINPDYAECYNNIGLYWSKLGDFKSALKNFSITLQLRPDLAEAYNNIAAIFMKIRRPTDAVKMLQ